MDIVIENFNMALTPPLVLSFSNFEQNFNVEAKTSIVAVGDFLSQKKVDERAKMINFWSRNMNASERNYVKCERKDLELIFVLNYLRMFPISFLQLNVITDHQKFLLCIIIPW